MLKSRNTHVYMYILLGEAKRLETLKAFSFQWMQQNKYNNNGNNNNNVDNSNNNNNKIASSKGKLGCASAMHSF